MHQPLSITNFLFFSKNIQNLGYLLKKYAEFLVIKEKCFEIKQIYYYQLY